MRHLTQLCVPPPSDAAIKTILSTILGGFLADWSPDLRALCGPIVASAVEAYNRVSAELLPTPDKSHYTFNLRDLSKVAQVSRLSEFGVLWCVAKFVTRYSNVVRGGGPGRAGHATLSASASHGWHEVTDANAE